MKPLQTVSITEAARNFSDVVNRVAYRGERFMLMRGRKRVAELRPALGGPGWGGLAAALGGGPRLSGAELRDFARDVSRVARGGGD